MLKLIIILNVFLFAKAIIKVSRSSEDAMAEFESPQQTKTCFGFTRFPRTQSKICQWKDEDKLLFCKFILSNKPYELILTPKKFNNLKCQQKQILKNTVDAYKCPFTFQEKEKKIQEANEKPSEKIYWISQGVDENTAIIYLKGDEWFIDGTVHLMTGIKQIKEMTVVEVLPPGDKTDVSDEENRDEKASKPEYYTLLGAPSRTQSKICQWKDEDKLLFCKFILSNKPYELILTPKKFNNLKCQQKQILKNTVDAYKCPFTFQEKKKEIQEANYWISQGVDGDTAIIYVQKRDKSFIDKTVHLMIGIEKIKEMTVVEVLLPDDKTDVPDEENRDEDAQKLDQYYTLLGTPNSKICQAEDEDKLLFCRFVLSNNPYKLKPMSEKSKDLTCKIIKVQETPIYMYECPFIFQEKDEEIQGTNEKPSEITYWISQGFFDETAIIYVQRDHQWFINGIVDPIKEIEMINKMITAKILSLNGKKYISYELKFYGNESEFIEYRKPVNESSQTAEEGFDFCSLSPVIQLFLCDQVAKHIDLSRRLVPEGYTYQVCRTHGNELLLFTCPPMIVVNEKNVGEEKVTETIYISGSHKSAVAFIYISEHYLIRITGYIYDIDLNIFKEVQQNPEEYGLGEFKPVLELANSSEGETLNA